MKIVITGAAGLLGWHAAARLHARNCAERFHSRKDPFEIVLLSRADFNGSRKIRDALVGADAVLHFAGVNRGPDSEVEAGNLAIAQALISACEDAAVQPHIVYANSIHSIRDTPYGRSKKAAGEIIAAYTPRYTDLMLPNIFGEGARPDYNNVTATFIDRIISGQRPEINSDGQVPLLHAGEAVETAIAAAVDGLTGVIAPAGRRMSVSDLFDTLSKFHSDYLRNLFPDLTDPFDLALFNSYRSALYPDAFPLPLKLNTDPRGTLFEASKGGGGGQTFLSWTHPGVTRGNHFHLRKVERFLVLEGEALIRMRRVLGDRVWEYRVSGSNPAPIDMPTLHTHSIENTGESPLLTLFWTQEIFDPAAPDTYADPVVGV